jgi:MoaA/NifB/PqqE/SkfB family radical SAM enzyme
MAGQLREFLEDPFLARLYSEIRRAGPIRAISVDLTHRCNLRCVGCYFFAEAMDRREAPHDDADLQAFVVREKARGTNFVTVIGGEPSLALDRLRTFYAEFRTTVVTNGVRRIPYEGFENMTIGVSVWGDHETDARLRGRGDIFARALRNYQGDPRADWYYTTTPGNAHEIERVVEQCVANGNRVMFNFYGDLAGLGGDVDHRQGFARVRREIDRMIERYPDRIWLSSYMSAVISTGRLYEERWGYDVCGSVSVDHAGNKERLSNGRPFNPHFRAYNPDLTTRRCCVGNERDCSTCCDVWAHASWIMLHMRRHLGSKQEFTNWLSTMYLFYLMNRLVDFDAGVQLLPEIHRRVRSWYDYEPRPAKTHASLHAVTG